MFDKQSGRHIEEGPAEKSRYTSVYSIGLGPSGLASLNWCETVLYMLLRFSSSIRTRLSGVRILKI